MGLFSWCTSDTKKSIAVEMCGYEGAPTKAYLLNRLLKSDDEYLQRKVKQHPNFQEQKLDEQIKEAQQLSSFFGEKKKDEEPER